MKPQETRIGLTPELPQTKETSRFKVEDGGVVVWGDKIPYKEGVVLHLKKQSFGEDFEDIYVLQKTVGKLHYILQIQPYFNYHVVSFKTLEYQFASVKLDDTQRDTLYKSMATMLEAVTEYDKNIDTILIEPSRASYTSEDLEKCIDEIVANSGQDLTREFITTHYQGNKILKLYEELFKKEFVTHHIEKGNRADTRSRLFRGIIKKYFKDWEIDDEYQSADFILRRKSKTPETEH